MFFNIIHDILSTMPNYVRIYIHNKNKKKHTKKKGQTNEQTDE